MPFHTNVLLLYLKVVVSDSNPKHFLSNSVNISWRSASCPFCVCAEKQSGVHTQPVLIPRSSDSRALSQLVHRTNWCCELLTRVWSSTEGRGVFVWLLSSNINKLSPGLQTAPLSLTAVFDLWLTPSWPLACGWLVTEAFRLFSGWIESLYTQRAASLKGQRKSRRKGDENKKSLNSCVHIVLAVCTV